MQKKDNLTLTFLSRLYYPHIGGVETHVSELSKVLLKRGYKINIITSQYESSLKLEETLDGVHIHRIPKTSFLSKRETWSHIRSFKPIFAKSDIIHVHDVFWWYLWQRLKHPKPTFITFHGWEGVYPPTFKAKVWRKISEKLSRGNICIGDFIKTWYGTNPTKVLYGATNQTPLATGNKNHVLILGRLSKDNDTDLILEALTKLKATHHYLKFFFLGDGQFASEAAKIGTVLGFQADISHYLADAHWVISSSYLSILDSLAADRIVFSVYSNNLKQEYLKTHPLAKYFTRSGTANELLTKLSTCISARIDPDPNQSADARSYTWEKVADEYETLWFPDVQR